MRRSGPGSRRQQCRSREEAWERLPQAEPAGREPRAEPVEREPRVEAAVREQPVQVRVQPAQGEPAAVREQAAVQSRP